MNIIPKQIAQPPKPRLWHDYNTMTAGATCMECQTVVDIVNIEYWHQVAVRNTAERTNEILKEEYRRICRENIQRWLDHQREYHGRTPVSKN